MSPNRKLTKKVGSNENEINRIKAEAKSAQEKLEDEIGTMWFELRTAKQFINHMRLVMGCIGGLIVIFCAFYDFFAYGMTHYLNVSIRSAEGYGGGQIIGAMVGGLILLFAVWGHRQR